MMGSFFAWLILIVGFFLLFYFRCSLRYAIPSSAIILFLASLGIPWIINLFFWMVWLVFIIVMMVYPFRWRWVMKPFLHWFRKQNPPLSSVERDVLEAGGLWFEKEFFLGRPKWRQLFQSTKPTLTMEEQTFIDNQVSVLCQLLKDWEIQQQNNLPEVVWDYLKKERFWGLIVEKKYGGCGFSAAAHSAIVTQIASRSLAAAITVMVPNSLGPTEFLRSE